MVRVLVAVMVAGGAVLGGEARPSPAGAEDRLLEAELLELASGELTKALDLYRSLAADAGVADGVKARAALGIARCQRKRGELEAAQRTLKDLIALHGKDRDIVRRANALLRELVDGRAENPQFDWIGDLQRNPEIQARIFDFIMDLVDEGEVMERSSRQLLALGTIALPALEQAAGSSRAPQHRRRLALVLLHLGKLEHLREALPPGHDYWESYDSLFDSFIDIVRRMGDDERARLRKALADRPDAGAEGGARDLVLLAAGDRSDLGGRLARIEGRFTRSKNVPKDYGRSQLIELLAADGAARAAMAGRILDPACDDGAAFEYIRFIEETAPDLLEARHYVAALELASVGGRYGPSDALFAALERRQGLGLLATRAANKTLMAAAIAYFAQTYGRGTATTPTARALRMPGAAPPEKTAEIRDAPPAWAPVLRAVGELSAQQTPAMPRAMPVSPRTGGGSDFGATGFAYLARLALVNDGAIGEFTQWLGSSVFTDDYLSVFSEDPRWQPSAAFAEAMASLLSAKNPLVLAVALERLALAPAGVGPDVTPQIERLLADPPDLHVRELALYALLRRFAERPETGPDGARILLADFSRWEERTVPLAYSESPLYGHWFLGTIDRRAGKDADFLRRFQVTYPTDKRQQPPAPRELSGWNDFYLAWIPSQLGPATILDFHAHLLKQARTPAAQRLYSWFFFHKREGDEPWRMGRLPQLSVGDHIERLVNDLAALPPEDAEATVFGFTELKESSEQLKELLRRGPPRGPFADAVRRFVADPKRPLELRASLLTTFCQEVEATYRWFDWPKLLASDDPLAEELDVIELLVATETLAEPFSEAARREIHAAALRSPLGSVRARALERVDYFGGDPAGLFATVLAGAGAADPAVRRAALWQLLRTSEQKADLRPQAIDAAARLILDPAVEILNPKPFWGAGESDRKRHPESASRFRSCARAERATLVRAALGSPWERWRLSALADSSLAEHLDDVPAVLEKALDDASPEVQAEARKRLLSSTDVRMVPSLTRLLDREKSSFQRLEIVSALERLAAPESIAALIAVTKDNDVTLRDKASEALRKIEARLAEDAGWEQSFGTLKPKPPPPKEAPPK